jgi:prolyl oligopeptidase
MKHIWLILLIVISCKKQEYNRLDTTDNYQFLENLKDSSTVGFIKSQNLKSENYFKNLKNLDSLASFMNSVENKEAEYLSFPKRLSNGTLFYKKWTPEDQYASIYRYRNGVEEKVFDFVQFYTDKFLDSYITYINPSWDGKYIALAIGNDLEDNETLIIIDVEAKKTLDYELTNCIPSGLLGVSWLPDSSGIMYLWYPNKDDSSEGYRQKSTAVLHKIGDKEDNLIPLLGYGFDGSPFKGIEDRPVIEVNSSNSKYLIGYKINTEQNWDAYYTEIKDFTKNKPSWKPLFKAEDKVLWNNNYFIGDDFYYLGSKDSGTYELIKKNIKSKEVKVIASPPKDENFTGFIHAKENLYAISSKNGIESKIYIVKNGNLKPLDLPIPAGNIEFINKCFGCNTIDLKIDGWLEPTQNYTLNPVLNEFQNYDFLNAASYDEFKTIKVKNVEVKSHDNKSIPLTILYDSSKEFNSNTPAILNAYGSYGDNVSPKFSVFNLSFVKKGGIFAVAHVRGGGEKGIDWYEEGKKSKKENSWKDYISCSEYLINNNYTANDKLFGYAESAGGIVVGMSYALRPDLYQGLISNAGALNISRHEFPRGIGIADIDEFGSANNPEELKSLQRMDAFLNLKPNSDYRSAFVIAGIEDNQVLPWMSMKFVDKLNHCKVSKDDNVLLQVNMESGHGFSFENYYLNLAKIISFVYNESSSK